MPDPKKPSTPRKPAARKPAAKPPASKYLRDREAAQDEAMDQDFEEFGPSKPVAVGGTSGLGARLASMDEEEQEASATGVEPQGFGTADFEEQLFSMGQQPPDAPAPIPGAADGGSVVDRPRDELLVGLASLLLAASVFLPWFRFGIGSKSGWAAGWFGPSVFFLALAAAVTVLLRKMDRTVVFPLEAPLILEGVGWVATLLILASNLKPPKIGFVPLTRHPMLFVSLVLAVGVALLAGRISGGVPLVVRPGWFSSAAGKLGAAILIVAVGAGAAFGFLNAGESTPAAPKTPKPIAGAPPCLKESKFPLATGVKAIQGYEANNYCIALLSSSASFAGTESRYRAALKSARWKFKVSVQPAGSKVKYRLFSLSAPSCGQLRISEDPDRKGRVAPQSGLFVQLYECPKPGSSPTAR